MSLENHTEKVKAVVYLSFGFVYRVKRTLAWTSRLAWLIKRLLCRLSQTSTSSSLKVKGLFDLIAGHEGSQDKIEYENNFLLDCKAYSQIRDIFFSKRLN